MYYLVFDDMPTNISNDAIYNAIRIVEEATSGIYTIQMTDILTLNAFVAPMTDQIILSDCSQKASSCECCAAAA